MKTIGRNDPCWCGSGLKYKKCHLNRATEEPMKIYEVDKIFQDEYKKEYCCVPAILKNDCAGNIIKAHSITKSSSLQAISQNGHVYGFKPSLQNLSKYNGSLILEKIGINQASIFTGFCSKHDNDLFKPIESGIFNESKEECFLHAYRALCKEYFTKNAAVGLESFRNRQDAGKTVEEQILYQNANHAINSGLNAGMNDLLKRKFIFDEILLTKKYDGFNSFIIKFNTIPSIVATGGKNIIFDFDGNSIQDLKDFSKLPSAIFYNYFSSNQNGYVVFSWIGNSDIIADQFIDSLSKINSKNITNAIIRFIFYCCENLYASPIWWEGLGSTKQNLLINRINSAVSPLESYNAKYLKDDNIDYDDWKFEKYIKL